MVVLFLFFLGVGRHISLVNAPVEVVVRRRSGITGLPVSIFGGDVCCRCFFCYLGNSLLPFSV
jgi:hypothetical protein